MAVSPIGNMIYVNQNMQVGASKQTDFQARLDAQHLAAGEALEDSKEEIAEVRPTEETYKIDPENEHEKERKKQEEEAGENAKEQKEESNNENKYTATNHKLDIKI